MTTTSPAAGLIAKETPDQILVALDFSDRAWSVLPLAQTMADELRISMTFVHVDQERLPVSDSSGSLHVQMSRGELPIDLRFVADRHVGEALARAAGPSSVIALGVHGRVGFSELAWGSVCSDLVKRGVPVLAVGPRFAAEPMPTTEQLLVCVDPAAPDPAFVQTALTWAQAIGVPAKLVTVAGDGMSRPDVDQCWSILTGMSEALNDSTLPVDVRVLADGDPAEAIERLAEQSQGSLIVMSMRRRSRRSRALSSTTRKLLRRCKSGVLLIPPPVAGATADAGTACHDDYPEFGQ